MNACIYVCCDDSFYLCKILEICGNVKLFRYKAQNLIKYFQKQITTLYLVRKSTC